jgi:NTP pyrophosphatase (non-canonical NTP hydrolase)
MKKIKEILTRKNLKKENEELFKFCIEKDSNNSFSNKLLKLTEEAGELNSEYLKLINASNASKSADGSYDALFTEAIDVYIVIRDIIANIESKTKLNFDEVLNKKLQKWKRKFND